MNPVPIFKQLQRKILVTRESASALRRNIDSSIKADGQLVLDFEGIDAVTPSFIDELLAIVDDARVTLSKPGLRVVFLHTPTALSAKFIAIGKRHDARISQSGTAEWEITPLPVNE